ncbi:MAG: DoxX family protein [Devosia sp.]|jgi:putative oxidoreductase
MTLTAILIIVGRLLLGGYFVQAGIRNFMKFELHTGILEKKGVPAPRVLLAVALAVQVLGGLSVALGVFSAIGAIGLIIFTIAANYLYHNFTQFTGAERQSHLSSVLANAAIVGGFLLVIAIS